MAEYDELASGVESAGNEIFWIGPASIEQVQRLENLLGTKLPVSFRRFLEDYGGGGVVSAEISGIQNDDASDVSGGTVLGDTATCRERFDLPSHLVVIYFQDDEVCWCLDVSESGVQESPVVSYNVFTGKVDGAIASNFRNFMRQHLALYSIRAV